MQSNVGSSGFVKKSQAQDILSGFEWALIHRINPIFQEKNSVAIAALFEQIFEAGVGTIDTSFSE